MLSTLLRSEMHGSQVCCRRLRLMHIVTHNLMHPGLTVGAWNLGCIVSAILTIFIGDILGRRRTLIVGLILWITGEIIQTSSYSFGQFVAGRAIAGFGTYSLRVRCIYND